MLANTIHTQMIEALRFDVAKFLGGGASGDLYEQFAAVNRFVEGDKANAAERTLFDDLARRVQVEFLSHRLVRNNRSEAYLGAVRSPDPPSAIAAVLRAALGAGSILLIARPAGCFDLWWRLPIDGQLGQLANEASRRAQGALVAAQRSGELRAADLYDYGQQSRLG